MSVFDEFKAGLLEAEATVPQVVTWAGNDYPILPGSAVRGKDLAAGGFKLRSDLKFIARCDMFPGLGPQLKQQVTYQGDAYRIDSLEKMPGGVFLRFECNDPSQ
jgi:hypothetical protein